MFEPEHTILSVLKASQVLQASPVQGSEGLTGDGSHYYGSVWEQWKCSEP